MPSYRASRLAPRASRLRPRKPLADRVARAGWNNEVAVTLPSWGRIGTAHKFYGQELCVKLYERHRDNMDAIREEFEVIYPGIRLALPTDPTELAQSRAAAFRRGAARWC